MTTTVGNRGQLWTSTLSPHLLSPHLDFPEMYSWNSKSDYRNAKSNSRHGTSRLEQCENHNSVPLPAIKSETWRVRAKVREPHLNPPLCTNFLPPALVLKGKARKVHTNPWDTPLDTRFRGHSRGHSRSVSCSSRPGGSLSPGFSWTLSLFSIDFSCQLQSLSAYFTRVRSICISFNQFQSA